MNKFEVGDRVKIKTRMYGNLAIITKAKPAFNNSTLYYVEFDSGMTWAYWDYEMELIDPTKEIEKKIKRDEMYIKMIDIDPYGEENWI